MSGDLALWMAAGFCVGGLVGLTGFGSGSAIVATLVFAGIPTAHIPGIALAVSVFSRLAAWLQHQRQQMVNWSHVLLLASGSLPGVMTVPLFLPLWPGARAETIFRHGIGWVLLASCMMTLVQYARSMHGHRFFWRRSDAALGKRYLNPLVGFITGVITGSTSIGAGSIVGLYLMVGVRMAPPVAVGTTTAHGLLLAAVGTLVHWRLGLVDWTMTLWLAMGVVPGALLGGWFANRVPHDWLRLLITALAAAAGCYAIWG